MQHTLLMCVVDSACSFANNLRSPGRGNGPIAQSVSQAFSMNKIHGVKVEALLLEDLANADDSRVVQAQSRLRLTPKPQNFFSRSESTRNQCFQCDGVLLVPVTCFVDNPHPATAHFFFKRIITELLQGKGKFLRRLGARRRRVPAKLRIGVKERP